MGQVATRTPRQALRSTLPLPGLTLQQSSVTQLFIRLDLSQLDLKEHFEQIKDLFKRVRNDELFIENGSIDQCNLVPDLFLENDKFVPSRREWSCIKLTSCHIGLKMMRFLYRIAFLDTHHKHVTVRKCKIDYEDSTLADLADMFVEDVMAEKPSLDFLVLKTIRRPIVELNSIFAEFEENTYVSWPISGAQDAETCLFELIMDVWKRIDTLDYMPLRGFALSPKQLKLICDAVSSLCPTRKLSMAIKSWDAEAADGALELIRSEPRLRELELGTHSNPPKIGSFLAESIAEALSSSIYLERFSMYINVADPVGASGILDFVEDFCTKVKYPNRLRYVEFKLSRNDSESVYGDNRLTHRDYQILQDKEQDLNQKLANMHSKKVKMLITLIYGSMNNKQTSDMSTNSFWDFLFSFQTHPNLLSLLSRDIFRELCYFL